jgi:hypothetical protein
MNFLQKQIKKRLNYVKELPPFTIYNKQINYSSILFFKNTSNREQNDANNKIRETIIAAVINNEIPEQYYYSIVWYNFKQRLINFIISLFPLGETTESTYNCKTMAGRNYNYDFLVTQTNIHGNQLQKKVEFKFNARGVTDCPQFLSLSTKQTDIQFNFPSYAEYFYDNYVEQITQMYSLTHIERTTYLKLVHQTNYDRHSWFSQLYSKEIEHIKDKKKLVDESIHKYILELYIPNIEEIVEQLKNKLVNTQSGKIYMIYSPLTKSFMKDEITQHELNINPENITIQSGSKDNIHTVIFHTARAPEEPDSTEIKLLLRWRNHAGVLNPAWQISIRRGV